MITVLENNLVEHVGAGYKSALHSVNGESIPMNEAWKDIEVYDTGEPGSTVTQAHWDRDIEFEERLMQYYSKMGRNEHTEYTMAGYLEELGNSMRGIRSNNEPHLRRIFKKAFDEIYLGNPLASEKEKTSGVEYDRAISQFIKSEGMLR